MIGPLTEKEQAVMDMLIAGKRDKEIGKLLGIQRRTVGQRVARVCDKLGVDTRTQAVAIYVKSQAG